MKKVLLLFALLACFAVSIFGTGVYARRLHMKGSLYLITVTRTATEPVLVYYTSEPDPSLELAVMVDNLINVKIYDPSGNVVSQTDLINKRGESVLINMAGWAAGQYEIVLTNPQNETQSTGVFEIGY